MIYIIINSYNEPKATVKAVRAFLEQEISEKFKIIVSDPFLEVKTYLKKELKDKRVSFFLDPGQGKSFALLLILKKIYSKNKKDIIIFTDGDVYTGKNTLNEILKEFKQEKIGGITGRPVPINLPTNKYGYWAKLSYGAIHSVRMRLSQEKKFLQFSGYLMAIRNGIIKDFSLDVPEDCVIPYLIWKAGYRVSYAPKAEVYVKYPDNWNDWVKQRVRTIKAHENIPIFYPDMPRTKSFMNEIKEGLFFTLKYPKNMKESYWILQLYFARLYIYLKSFFEVKKKKAFDPMWRDYSEIQSAKPLD